MNIQELDALTAAELSADTTEELYSMEQDARHIADHIYDLAVRMDKAGLPANILLPAMLNVCALGATFGLTGDIGLLRQLLEAEEWNVSSNL